MFMRIAAPEFGPVALIGLRVTTAALFLVPLLALRGSFASLWQHRGDIALAGLVNSALPFTLFAYATLYLTAGYTAVINATAPLFTALVAFLWIGERLSRVGVVGLLVGLGGVVVLVRDQLGVELDDAALAIAGGLGASLCYGFAANHARIRLAGAGSLTLAAGSQLSASLLLAPLSLMFWPSHLPSTQAWMAVLALGVLCTGIAYILYFRLLLRLGPARAVTVTYLVPLAAMVAGALFLDETITGGMLLGCGLILLGTGLATGVVRLGRGARSA
jgi:drug/metabolite transporter (DMT)-like permease